MTDDEKSLRKPRQGMLDKFEPDGELGPIEDRTQRDQRLNQLPPGEKELAEETGRMADLCQYFSTRRMDIPDHLVALTLGLTKLSIVERILALKHINDALMEYLDRVGEDPQLRQ